MRSLEDATAEVNRIQEQAEEAQNATIALTARALPPTLQEQQRANELFVNAISVGYYETRRLTDEIRALEDDDKENRKALLTLLSATSKQLHDAQLQRVAYNPETMNQTRYTDDSHIMRTNSGPIPSKRLDFPNFYGDPKRDNIQATEFLRRVEMCATVGKWDNPTTLIQVRQAMSGLASCWVSNLEHDKDPVLNDWVLFKEEFIERFEQVIRATDLHNIQLECKQEANEKISQFFDRLSNIHYYLNKEAIDGIVIEDPLPISTSMTRTAHLKWAFIAGIKPDVQTQVTKQVTKKTTLKEIVKLAKKIEDTDCPIKPKP